MSFLSQPIQDILIKPTRTVGDIKVRVVVNESAVDTLTITKQPVQQGASITDHAYMEPTAFTHDIYFEYNLTTALSKVYQQLLTLQSNAIPFDIVTPKRVYKKMLMATLSQTTDKLTENCLAIHASYQQVIIVPILAAAVPRANQKNPARTGATQNGGQKSVLLKTIGSPFSSFFGGG